MKNGVEEEGSATRPRPDDRNKCCAMPCDPPGLHCDSIIDSQALEQNPFASGIIRFCSIHLNFPKCTPHCGIFKIRLQNTVPDCEPDKSINA